MSEILRTHTQARLLAFLDLGEFKEEINSGVTRLAVHNNKHEAGSSSLFRIAHRGTTRVRESPGAPNVYVYVAFAMVWYSIVCYGMGREVGGGGGEAYERTGFAMRTNLVRGMFV